LAAWAATRFVYWSTPWLSTAVAVVVASEWYPDYSWLAKIGIAISAYVVTGLALGALVVTIEWCLKQGFFWIIDVVPSKGADLKEAEAIVLGGKRYLTNKKLSHHIDQWTDDDTAFILRLVPWRVRPFFQQQSVERFKQRVRVMKENFERTGKQPAELSPTRSIESPRSPLSSILSPKKTCWRPGIRPIGTTRPP
jgi:hypothetical protein